MYTSFLVLFSDKFFFAIKYIYVCIYNVTAGIPSLYLSLTCLHSFCTYCEISIVTQIGRESGRGMGVVHRIRFQDISYIFSSNKIAVKIRAFNC